MFIPDKKLYQDLADGSAAVQIVEPDLIQNVDEPDDTTTYIGYARPGTLDSEAKWKIKKISVVGTVTKTRLANGVRDFNQVWDNRASLSYS